ncbi:hypothetical protein OIE13_17060 [Streptosporangium sp. NBC_01810]|uniref:hypothetical protein n=1 Tax=Streptosporangium sp. NBC_01810 TaxID=2975951 RepID=UPI002DD87304|nr:hypothetical protein [Streptosporangium sp. NBC_01810]WSA29437.1 hypothetical protein OIE13_17060 [Streptosporangium sp. NBC_01810]
MTPGELDKLHAEAVKRGADPKKLDRLRQEALQECGSVEEMARWATWFEKLAYYYMDLRGEIPRDRF